VEMIQLHSPTRYQSTCRLDYGLIAMYLTDLLFRWSQRMEIRPSEKLKWMAARRVWLRRAYYMDQSTQPNSVAVTT